MKFKRRTFLIGALMKLHNFCINHNITETTTFRTYDSASEGPMNFGFCPGDSGIADRWQRAPLFDKDGVPVEFFDTEGHHSPAPAPDPLGEGSAAEQRRARQLANASRQLELRKAVKDAGLVRPKLKRGRRNKRASKKKKK